MKQDAKYSTDLMNLIDRYTYSFIERMDFFKSGGIKSNLCWFWAQVYDDSFFSLGGHFYALHYLVFHIV